MASGITNDLGKLNGFYAHKLYTEVNTKAILLKSTVFDLHRIFNF